MDREIIYIYLRTKRRNRNLLLRERVDREECVCVRVFFFSSPNNPKNRLLGHFNPRKIPILLLLERERTEV